MGETSTETKLKIIIEKSKNVVTLNIEVDKDVFERYIQPLLSTIPEMFSHKNPQPPVAPEPKKE
jgi:hypothetical protein